MEKKPGVRGRRVTRVGHHGGLEILGEEGEKAVRERKVEGEGGVLYSESAYEYGFDVEAIFTDREDLRPVDLDFDEAVRDDQKQENPGKVISNE